MTTPEQRAVRDLIRPALAAARAAHISAAHVATFGHCNQKDCRLQYEVLRALGWNR